MLTIFQSDNQAFQLMQTSWASQLNSVLANPVSTGVLLQNVTLAIGTNAISHKLGRKLQGWIVVRKRAAASIYDTQDTNVHPELTLSLVSDAAVKIDLYVF